MLGKTSLPDFGAGSQVRDYLKILPLKTYYMHSMEWYYIVRKSKTDLSILTRRDNRKRLDFKNEIREQQL